MRYVRSAFALLGVSLCLLLAHCGGGDSSNPPPAGVLVEVNPQSSSVIIGQTQQFTAAVSNSANATVQWSVNGVAGGNAEVGTISDAGLYTAPAKLPDPADVTVNASSVADNTKSDSGTVTVAAYTGVLTYHNDNGRTGQNLNETTLTLANVNPTKFGKVFDAALDGQVYAQPLYLSHAVIGGAVHNVVYVATEHDTVYAFDADGLSPTPLWTKSLLMNGGTPIPDTDYGTTGSPVKPEIGITSTPVIDGTTGTIYVLAVSKESGNYIQRLHALDVVTGAEKFGGPVTIQATVSGTGLANTGGQIAFQPFLQLQRVSLLLSKGVIYIAWASYNDAGLYHGWVMAYDAANLHQTAVWNVTPNGGQGGIWLSNAGLSADSDGNVYVLTGNGTFDADTGGSDYGESFVKLNLTSGGLVVSDFFTPFNQAALTTGDVDLGSSGLVLLPDMNGPVTHLGITAGKEGKIYLVNLDDLGKYQSGSDSQIVQSIPEALGPTGMNGRNLSTAVYWQGNVYFVGKNGPLKQYKLTNGQLASFAQSTNVFGYTAASSVSANGASDGILWTLESGGDVLHAYDAGNVATELCNIPLNQPNGFGRLVRFNPPTIANGKVYVAGQTKFAIFGLLP
jgi:hypothetical protein